MVQTSARFTSSWMRLHACWETSWTSCSKPWAFSSDSWMTRRASDTIFEKTIGSTPTFTCWDCWSWYSKMLWTEVWGPLEAKPEGNSMTSWNNCRMPTRVMNLWQTFDNLWHVASSLSLPSQTFGTGTPRYWRRTSFGPLRWCFSNSSWNVRWFTTNVQTVEIRCGIWAWHLNLTPQVSKSLGTTCYDADAAKQQGRKIQTQIKFGCPNSKCKPRLWN